MVPKRFRALEERRLVGGLRVFVASSSRARLLGLALLKDLDSDQALLIPRCSSVHTFGMRFPIDVAFLDSAGRELRLARAVRPGRVVSHRGAAAVLERRAASPPGAPASDMHERRFGPKGAPASETLERRCSPQDEPTSEASR